MPFPLLIPLIAAGVSAIGNIISNRQQKKSNMQLAKFQADANEKYLAQQNAYNTPKAQMARYGDAGLNPNLIYGQGTPGNQSQALSYPDTGRVDYSRITPEALQMFNQTSMTMSQTQAIDAKTRQTYAMTELNKMQAKLIAANPLLNDEGFKATMDALKMTAELKGTQWNNELINLRKNQATEGAVVTKAQLEVEALVQKLGLQTQDAAIKAQILKSQEFRNAILEVQKRFMTDGNVTPQHVLQFVQMLLLKLF